METSQYSDPVIEEIYELRAEINDCEIHLSALNREKDLLEQRIDHVATLQGALTRRLSRLEESNFPRSIQ